jgi:hypothetical protein
LYRPQPDCDAVLKAHARTHFAHSLAAQRLALRDMPADMKEAARRMLQHEERFARAWMAAVGDTSFDAELREDERKALVLLRTAIRPIYLVGNPACDDLDEDDARELGKAWANLDKLAESLGLAPLSNFLAFDEEGDSAGVPASELLPIVDALMSAMARPGQKFSSKRAALAVLKKVRSSLDWLNQQGGRAHFEVDI